MPRFPTAIHPTGLGVAALLIAAVSGCSGVDLGAPAQSGLPGPTTTSASSEQHTSAKAAAADYGPLLLTAADLSDEEDTFAERSKEAKPNGVPGARAFFVNDADTRAISDTVLIYPDAGAAAATLRQASGTLDSLVVGGTAKPAAVGTDGVTISGSSPDNDREVTLLVFTEGRALVRLEFQSATGDVTTDRFVTSIGRMQAIALRLGLAAT